MQQIVIRILTSIALSLGARIIDGVLKELMRMEQDKKSKGGSRWGSEQQDRIATVLPHALKIIAGGKR